MKRILFVASASEMGGVEFSTLYLVAHLDRKQWSPMVISLREGKLAEACRAEQIPVEILPARDLIPTSIRLTLTDLRLPNPLAWLWNVGLLWRSTHALRRLLTRAQPDLVITKGLPAHFFGGMAARLAKIRCVWHVQDFISERFLGLYRVVFGCFAASLPDAIIVDGRAIASQLPGKIQGRVQVILNGVDTGVFHPDPEAGAMIRRELKIPAQAVVIGHAARITPWKGQHHLLEAFAKIAPQHPQARLLLVGSALFDHDDYERHLKTHAQALGLQEQVIFAGFRGDLAHVLNAMDIFAYPSVEKDTSPLALLSALACGLPVVAFDIAGMHEVLGTTGVIVPVKDEEKMAAALEQLVMDAALRQEQQRQSRQLAVTRFSLEQYVKNMAAVFSQQV